MEKNERLDAQAQIVGMIMEDADERIKVEQLDGGTGILASHKVTFKDTVVYVTSEEDAKTAKAAFVSLLLAMAVKFSAAMANGDIAKLFTAGGGK